MQINELEMKTGLDRATIRFYEKEGMITPTRLENGYRDYSGEDLQQLLKIKLLRQLGVSLLKIKDLQQGSEDFQEVLREQIAHLEKQRDSAQRSSQVCKLMQTDRVTYSSMDPNYYLEKFRTTQLVYPQNPVAPQFPDRYSPAHTIPVCTKGPLDSTYEAVLSSVSTFHLYAKSEFARRGTK